MTVSSSCHWVIEFVILSANDSTPGAGIGRSSRDPGSSSQCVIFASGRLFTPATMSKAGAPLSIMVLALKVHFDVERIPTLFSCNSEGRQDAKSRVLGRWI